MRIVQGFIVIGEMQGTNWNYDLLYGKNTGKGRNDFESFEVNGLVPYGSLKEANKARKNILVIPEARMVIPARLEMKIAEDVSEFEFLKKCKKIVVVRLPCHPENEGSYTLFGPCVKGRPEAGALGGAYLVENGLGTYRDYRMAFYHAGEVGRQSGIKTVLASFNLRRIMKYKMKK